MRDDIATPRPTGPTGPTGRRPVADPDPAPPSFGQLLRLHRERAGLTQQSLAGLSMIGARTIRDLESGRARARSRTVTLLADGLRLAGRVRDQFVQAGLCGRPVGPDPLPPFAAPIPLTPLVGRDVEVAAILDALTSGRRRVIALCGLPGVGKTRLATELAGRLSGQHGWSVVWLDAGPSSTADLVETVADAVSAVGACAGGDALLVLDGVEDRALLSGLAPALAAWARARVLVTSRAPHALPGVQPTVLGPLTGPGSEWDAPLPAAALSRLARVPAVRLLVERLAEVQTGFVLDATNAPAVVALARRCAGVPLVVELLACRARFLGVEELARLPPGELLSLRRSGPDGPHDSVAELLATSLARLDRRQRAVLSELARAASGLTVADVAAALGRTPGELGDDLTVVAGHGLVEAVIGSAQTQLMIPALLRAYLQGAPHELRGAATRIRGDCVPGRGVASSNASTEGDTARRGELMAHNSLEALRAAGILDGPMSPEIEAFFGGLTQNEVDVLVSTKERLSAILPDVALHSQGKWDSPEATALGYQEMASKCMCGAWSGSGSGQA